MARASVWYRWLTLLCAFLLTAGLSVAASGEELSKTARAQIDLLGNAVSGGNQETAHVLMTMGFPPRGAPAALQHWQAWPTTRMLEYAYVAAEASKPGQGDAMLKNFARVMASHHVDSIRHEPNLSQYFNDAPIDQPISEHPREFHFTVPRQEVLAMPLDRHVKRVIDVISGYTETLPKDWLLNVCCNLNPDEARTLELHSPNEAAVLEKGVLLKPPPPTVDEKLRRLVEAVQADNPALMHEPALERVMPPNGLHPHPFSMAERVLGAVDARVAEGTHQFLSSVAAGRDDLPNPASNASHPSAEVQRKASEDIFNAYNDAHYRSDTGPASGWTPGGAGPSPGPGPAEPSAGGRAFAMAESGAAHEMRMAEGAAETIVRTPAFGRMMARAGGFGGVIFGNIVEAQRGVPVPTSISWISGPLGTAAVSPQTKELWGRLLFVFAGGSTAQSHLIRADSVVAAKAIAMDHTFTGGIGLIGYTGPCSPYRVDAAGHISALGSGLSYVVNPNVATTRVGRAGMMLDTLPMVLGSITDQAKASGVSGEQLEDLKSTFENDSKPLGQYKFTDVHLQVQREPGGIVSVVRDPRDSPFRDASLRRAAFITLFAFNDDTSAEDDDRGDIQEMGFSRRPENYTPFYKDVPVLTQISEPFSRVNEFSEVLALLRWARAKGAKWNGPTPPASNLQPVSVVSVKDNTYTFYSSCAAIQYQLLSDSLPVATRLATKTGNRALIAWTKELNESYRILISDRGTMAVLGSTTELLTASFIVDPMLKRQYPEIVKKLILAESQQAEASEAAEDWLIKNTGVLDGRIRGLKLRKSLESRIMAKSKEIRHKLDPEKVVDELDGPFKEYLKELDAESRKQLASADDEAKKDPTAKAILPFLEKTIQQALLAKKEAFAESKTPGLARWLSFERELYQSLFESS